jgi:hypothetical protein
MSVILTEAGYARPLRNEVSFRFLTRIPDIMGWSNCKRGTVVLRQSTAST